jgi:hypothetical protein
MSRTSINGREGLALCGVSFGERHHVTARRPGIRALIRR